MALEFGLVHREKKRDGDIIFVGDATDKVREKEKKKKKKKRKKKKRDYNL